MLFSHNEFQPKDRDLFINRSDDSMLNLTLNDYTDEYYKIRMVSSEQIDT